MIDLNNIKVFVCVIEAGSFSAASKAIGMPSTTVSRKVQLLEQALGVRLLHRSTRKLSLTDEGHAFFIRCQQHLEGIDQATDLIMQLQSEPQGKIRITAPLDFSILYAQSWINEFLCRYPNINIEMLASDLPNNIIEDRIDIAFRSGALKDSSLIARPIGPKKSICCASPDYLKRYGKLDHPEDLSQHDCLLLGTKLNHNIWKFIKKGEVFDISVTGRYAVNSMHLLIQAAIEGLGVVYLPFPLAEKYIKTGQLNWVLNDYHSPESNMHIIYQSHKFLAAPIRLFIDFIMEKTQPNTPWLND